MASPRLPGAGIGGIFYLLIAVLMPLRELSLNITASGQRVWRWRPIALAVGLAGGILASIWAELALLNALLVWLRGLMPGELGLAHTGFEEQLAIQNIPALAFMAAMAGFISLGLVYLSVLVIGFFCSRKERQEEVLAETEAAQASADA